MNITELLHNIDFPTERIPLYGKTSTSAVVESGKEAIVRTDLATPTTLGVVTKDYRFISHKDVVANFLRFTEPLGATVVKHLHLPQAGAKMFAQIEYPEHPINLGNDKMNLMLTISNSYDTTKAFSIRFGAYRLVCSNGLVIGEGVLNHRQTHMRSLDIEALQNSTMENVNKQIDTFKSIADKLITTKMNHFQAISFLDDLEKQKKMTSYHVTRLKLHYNNPMFHAEDNTAWKLYNAMTEYATHSSKLSPERKIAISELAWKEISKLAA